MKLTPNEEVNILTGNVILYTIAENNPFEIEEEELAIERFLEILDNKYTKKDFDFENEIKFIENNKYEEIYNKKYFHLLNFKISKK